MQFVKKSLYLVIKIIYDISFDWNPDKFSL